MKLVDLSRVIEAVRDEVLNLKEVSDDVIMEIANERMNYETESSQKASFLLKKRIFIKTRHYSHDQLNTEYRNVLKWEDDFSKIPSNAPKLYRQLALEAYMLSIQKIVIKLIHQSDQHPKTMEHFNNLITELKSSSVTLLHAKIIWNLREIADECESKNIKAVTNPLNEYLKIMNTIVELKEDTTTNDPWLGLKGYAKAINQSDILSPFYRFIILSNLKKEFKFMKNLKINLRRNSIERIIKSDCVERDLNILLRVYEKSKSAFKLNKKFIDRFFIFIHQKQEPRYLLQSLDERLVIS